MSIFLLSDLHLHLNNPEKNMGIFGDNWKNHHEKILLNWNNIVQKEDLVLISGDISWAMTLEEAEKDLSFISRLNGIKILSKGNHDYWWSSVKKINDYFKKNNYNMYALQYTNIQYKDYIIAAFRSWDYKKDMKEKDIKHYEKELLRFDITMNNISCDKDIILMMHYPPFLENEYNTPMMKKIENQTNIKIVCFGHLHGNINKKVYNRSINGIKYFIGSSDLSGFSPTKIVDN